MSTPRNTARVLYRVPEAMAMLSLSRTAIYELIRSHRLRSVKQGRCRRSPSRPSRSTLPCSSTRAKGPRDGYQSAATRRGRRALGREAPAVHRLPHRRLQPRRKAHRPAGSGKTEAQARAKLKKVIRDHDDGLAIAPHALTIAQVVNDWLAYGLTGRSRGTVDKCTHLCQTHVIPALGRRKARELSAMDVDRWLADKAKTLSTRTLHELSNA